jgi:hypothetical protein
MFYSILMTGFRLEFVAENQVNFTGLNMNFAHRECREDTGEERETVSSFAKASADNQKGG